MSIPKSIALLGIGRDNLRLIPTDESFRMIPGELEARIHRGQSRRQNTYSRRRFGWHGQHRSHRSPSRKLPRSLSVTAPGFTLTAPMAPWRRWRHREKFDGLELADSISLDPHKWLYQPLDCGCLLYRSPEAAQQTFSHSGDYARSLSADPIEGFVFFEESMELSRRFRALKLWLSLRYHGCQCVSRDPSPRIWLKPAAWQTPLSENLNWNCWRLWN